MTLEGYAYACASLIAKNNSALPREDGHPDLIITVPELPGYPDDADGWRAMDVKLAGRCLDLRNRIGGSQGLIYFVLDVDEDAVWDTVAEKVSERDLEAWSIARDLRRNYDLDKVDLVWDFLHFLEVTLKDAKGRLEVEQEGKAHHLAELSADDRPECPETLGSLRRRQPIEPLLHVCLLQRRDGRARGRGFGELPVGSGIDGVGEAQALGAGRVAGVLDGDVRDVLAPLGGDRLSGLDVHTDGLGIGGDLLNREDVAASRSHPADAEVVAGLRALRRRPPAGEDR